MEIAFKEIETEFNQTFGYVKQDISMILGVDLNLNYTIALLVCCACEMLTWHRGLRDDEACDVFTSLFPSTGPYKAVGKTLWEALRNGLAHNFRPDTIRIEDNEWRITISSQNEPHMSVTKRHSNRIDLNINIRTFSSQVISQINAYEEELRVSPDARLRFHQKSKSKRYVRTISAEARIADAFRAVLGEALA